MASTYVVNYADMREIGFPVSGAGANIPIGTLMMNGATNGTNKGVLIPVTAASNTVGLGVLNEFHNFSASGDATTATLVQWFPISGFDGGSFLLGSKTSGGPFPSHRVDLFDTMVAVKVDYSQTSTVAVASATTTALTITGEVAGEDSTFVYVNAGTGIGQLGFIKSSTTDTLTLTSALTTPLDNTSKLTKVLPLFYSTVIWKVNTTTQPTTLDSVAGNGTGRAVVLANFLGINGLTTRLDPKIYHNAQSLNTVSQLNFYSYLGLTDTAFHPIA